MIDRLKRRIIDDRPLLHSVQLLDLYPFFSVGLAELGAVDRMLALRVGSPAGERNRAGMARHLPVGNIRQVGGKRRKLLLRDQLHLRPLT